MGFGFNFRKYSLNSKDLVFSDQWNDFGEFIPYPLAGPDRDLIFINDKLNI